MKLKPEDKESSKQSNTKLGAAIVIGLGVGIALGVALNSFAIGIAMFIVTAKKYMLLARFLLAVLIAWNLLFIAQYILGMVPHGEAVEFTQVLHNQLNVFSEIFGVFSKII